MPHSKPDATSLTSSLKRLSDPIRPVHTVSPSRCSRTLAARGMLPEVSMQPHTTPDFESLKTWRTSAVPSTTSLSSGLSMPSSACFTSSTAL